MAQVVERDLLDELLHVPGLLRTGPDRRQIAAEDVDDLGQLVVVGSAEEAAEGSDAGVAQVGPLALAGAGRHSPELENPEDATVLPHSVLAEEERSPVGDEVADGNEWKADGKHDRARGGDQEIGQPLHPPVAGTVDLADVEHEGDALELPKRELPEPLVVEKRQGPDPDSLLVKAGGLGDDRLVGLRLAVQDH